MSSGRLFQSTVVVGKKEHETETDLQFAQAIFQGLSIGKDWYDGYGSKHEHCDEDW